MPGAGPIRTSRFGRRPGLILHRVAARTGVTSTGLSVVPNPDTRRARLEPEVRGDERGFFVETWNARTFLAATGLERTFVQDNHSRSARIGAARAALSDRSTPRKAAAGRMGAIFDVAGRPAAQLSDLRALGGCRIHRDQPPPALGAGGLRARLRGAVAVRRPLVQGDRLLLP